MVTIYVTTDITDEDYPIIYWALNQEHILSLLSNPDFDNLIDCGSFEEDGYSLEYEVELPNGQKIQKVGFSQNTKHFVLESGFDKAFDSCKSIIPGLQKKNGWKFERFPGPPEDPGPPEGILDLIENQNQIQNKNKTSK